RRKMRNTPAPADEGADQHRDTNREADQMSDPEKRKGQKEIVTADRAATADSKSLRDVRGENLRCHDDGKYRSHNRSPQHREETGAAVLDVGSVLSFISTADFQNFSACDAFGIRQIRLRHQRATERNGIHHAENSAERADPKRRPERKVGPITDHD